MSIKNKFWYKVEKYVTEKLGLRRIGFSGGQWPNKEDGESEDIICQIKATKKKQITIKADDLVKLYKRSLIQHKIPVFAFYIDSIEFENAKCWIAVLIDNNNLK